jgi:hypothetical protein
MDGSQPTSSRLPTLAIILIAVGALLLIGHVFNVRVGAVLWPPDSGAEGRCAPPRLTREL